MTRLAELRIRLLGGLEVDGATAAQLGSRKARTLLKLLALAQGTPVRLHTAVDALWPEDMPARPADQVGVLVSRLRTAVGSDRLRRTEAGWVLDTDWLDVSELESRAQQAAERLRAGRPGAARAAADAALALVRGPLLPEEDGEWVAQERSAIDRLVAVVRMTAAEGALSAGDPGMAASQAEAALSHDPYDETALRILMRAHVAAGRPASALAAYARTRSRLAEDLGVDPMPETEALHTAVLLEAPDMATLRTPGQASARLTLVGRDAELAVLENWLERARTGEAFLASVEGEPGIGKTALVSAWAQSVTGRALVVSGRCDELAGELPLQPVLDAFDSLVGELGVDEGRVVLGEDAPVLSPLLAFAARGEGARPSVVTDAEMGRARLFTALVGAFRRAAGSLPLVFVVEDVHLAGPSTLEWLRFAVRRGGRLLVVTTRRSGQGPPLETETTLSLGPLDLEAVRALVGPARSEELWARSGGNPLFALELATAPGRELPSTITEGVARRVDALGPAAATIRTAAILGHECDVDLIASVTGVLVADLLDHLEAAAKVGLVDDRGAALSFRHELVRNALIAGSSPSRRAYVHRQAAMTLAARGGADPLVVAWHARQAGELELAAEALVEASALARARFDLAAAEAHATDAVTLADSALTRLARGRVRLARWNTQGALEDAERAFALGAGPAALELAGLASYYGRDYEAAARHLDEALAGSDDPTLRASCLTLGGRLLHARGELAGAEQWLTEAAEGRTPSRPLAQLWLSVLRGHQGRVADSLDLAERVLLHSEDLDHPFGLYYALFHHAMALGMAGRPVPALQAVARLEETSERAGDSGRRFLAVAHNVHAWLLRNLGLLEEADALNHRAVEACSGAGAQSVLDEPRFAGLLDLAEGALQLGDHEAVAAMVEQSADVDQWQGTMSWHQQDRRHLLVARHLLATGDVEAAAAAAAEVEDRSRARGAGRYEVLGGVVALQAAALLGADTDQGRLETLLDQLESVAGLEAWWHLADVAVATGSDALRRRARQRAALLVSVAGPYGDALAAWVDKRLA